MAIIKHIKSRNANYSDALEYLLFQHNEKTGKAILDDSGRKLLREEFYMDGLHCDPMSFDKECEKTNTFFHKNQKRGDIKSHHYIISFDPADATGFKHRSTTRFLNHLKKEVMEMCDREGLHQVDLLSPAPAKITREEYWAKTHGQDQMNKTNEKIRAAGLKPASTVFQTKKQFLRDAIDDCSQLSGSFDEFQSLLLDKYNISVIEKRGSYRYLHPDRDRRISAESLGANYGKAYLEQQFQNHSVSKVRPHESSHRTENVAKLDYHADPFMIFFVKSELRLVTDLQTNIKAMQNQAYARKVKISNLKQMADTLL